MAKTVHDDVLDTALNYIKNNATRFCICSAQPTTFTEATATYKMGILTISSADFTGPSDGTTGRKITVNGQNGISIDATDEANYLALCDFDNSKLLYVTPCSPVNLESGNTVNSTSWDITIEDPV